MEDDIYKVFLKELKALNEFFLVYKRFQPDLADVPEEDPDVQRLIETMAFFTAHTQVSSTENIKNTERRLWQELFPFLFEPLPAISILQAQLQTPGFKLATILPQGSNVSVKMGEDNPALQKKFKTASFYTKRDLKITPVLLKQIENHQQKQQLTLQMASVYPQSGGVENINIYVNYLDDYSKSLHLFLVMQNHLQKTELVFEDGSSIPCQTSFGLQPDPQDLDSEYFQHPLYKARMFLHFPQQDLYINIKPDTHYLNRIPQPWNQYSVVFTFDESWKSIDVQSVLGHNPFFLHTVPIINSSYDSSAVLHFDGTQIRQPIYSTRADFSLQSVKGVYKIINGVNVAIRPGFIRGDSESYEIEYFKNLAWLIYYSQNMYTHPQQLVVAGLWYQPWITNYLAENIEVSLYDRKINYTQWKLNIPIEPSTPSFLIDKPDEVLYIIFWQKKFFLDAEQQLSLLRSLPDIQKSVFYEIPDLISSLNIETCNTLYNKKIMYKITFNRITPVQLDLSKALFRILVMSMNAYTNDDVEFFVKVILNKTSDYYITADGNIHPGNEKE